MFQSGFNQNYVTPMSGFNNYNPNPTATQQPSRNRIPTYKNPYDYAWAEKPSQNGEFKYGLFQCCKGPNGCLGILYIVLCLIPWPGWPMVAVINGQVADVVGKLVNIVF